MEDETLRIALAIVAVGGTVIGTVLGSWLSRHAAKDARDEEREYVAVQRLADEEREAAIRLDEALADAERVAGDLVKEGMPSAALRQAVQLFDPAHARYTMRLRHQDLVLRIYTVSAFLIGAQVAVPVGSETIDYGLLDGLQRIIGNARVSLDAFRLGEDLPDASLPGRELIAELLHAGEKAGAPLEVMRQWMEDNPPCDEVRAYLEARRDGR